MAPHPKFDSVRFSNYKALRDFSVSLGRLNILVGPNNSGKSTILGAFRILAEGIRRARNRNATVVNIGGTEVWGHRIPLVDLPISTENVFTDYDENNPARIDFVLSNKNRLSIVFPQVGVSYLVPNAKKGAVLKPSAFKNSFPVNIGFVPVLGPVEHEEPLYQKEAARKALLTHRASRNFRNIWHHFPEDFDEFRDLIKSTWPEMDIELPEIQPGEKKSYLVMFCPEERYPREIYWAGFGFQVWCQMLTYAIRSREDTLLIIDEPDIYLHSDLQRQLFSFLQDLGPDILIATHSTEIITEAEPNDLLIINKRAKSAKRLKDISGLRNLFEGLGSNLNPVLTQLAKSRRGLFVEGKDFQLLGAFALKLRKSSINKRSVFAVVSVGGFIPERIQDYSKGIELTLGTTILKSVIFDRDYRSDAEVQSLSKEMGKKANFVHIYQRKEIENYLLEAKPLHRTTQNKIDDQNARTGQSKKFSEGIEDILERVTDEIKHDVAALFQTGRTEYERRLNPGLAPNTAAAKAIKEFDQIWSKLDKRLEIVPGKEILSRLNAYLQKYYDISITPKQIINNFRVSEIPSEITDLIKRIEEFQRQEVPKGS